MTDIDALIERLKKATEGSRDFDGEIYRFLAAPNWQPDVAEQTKVAYYRGYAEHYTTSLDAALSLVPEPRIWGVSEGHKKDGDGKVATAVTHTKRTAAHYGEIHTGIAATPALALCIAALRARRP